MSAFNKLLVAGELDTPGLRRPAPTPASIASRLQQRVGTRIEISCPALEPSQLNQVVQPPAKVLDYRQVSDLANWAPPGHSTYLLAHHENPQSPAPWRNLTDLVRKWAGNDGAALELPTALAQAQTRLQGRRLRILTTTDRPLSGLSSAMAIRPDLSPSQLDADSIAQVNALARLLDQTPTAEIVQLNTAPATGGLHVGAALGGTNTTSAKSRPSQLPGSGAGWGIGALALALGGQVFDAWEAMAQLSGLAQHPPTDLAVALCPPLHSHTVGYSVIPVLGQWAQAHAIPLVAFTTDHTLARFEAAQWGIHHIYRLKPADLEDQIMRVLTGTWIR